MNLKTNSKVRKKSKALRSIIEESIAENSFKTVAYNLCQSKITQIRKKRKHIAADHNKVFNIVFEMNSLR